MRKPQPMVRQFAVAILLDQHGVGGASPRGLCNIDVDDEWAPDWEAVQLTVIATGEKFLWWPVAPELIAKAEENAIRNLIEWPALQLPAYYHKPG